VQGEAVFTSLRALERWLVSAGLHETAASYLVAFLKALLLALLAYLVHLVVKRVLLNFVTQFARRTRTNWDDVLIQRKLFHRAAQFAPAILVWRLVPVVFQNDIVVEFARRSMEIYMLLIGLLVVDSLLNASNDIYQRFEVSRRIPILGYLQVVKIVVTVAVIIVAASIIIDKSPLLLLSGLGALTAVILLIFKDSILGLVAGIQLVANDMVRPGDWIEMPKYGADGDVIEITLNTVKVQNWDKTITTIPTYTLISDSFKNWRGMSESGGRRIKRAIYLDVNSIRFCTPEMIEKFSRIQVLKDYLQQKQAELREYNQKHNIDETVLVNGRRMTNVGTFRAYVIEYLHRHPKIHQDMTFLVRHLEPSEKGLPLEIYVFSNDQAWANYEAIQADIFDHIFAALPEFGLRPFQNPIGSDIAALGDVVRNLRPS
jgi:miniconductance mechanosensitive channel